MDPEIAQLLDLESVPPVTTTRWVARRKAQVVAAVQAGLFTIEEACDLYKLTLEEFLGWQQTIRETGIRGLQITKRRVPTRVKSNPAWFGNA
jgi:hypothetical protein